MGSRTRKSPAPAPRTSARVSTTGRTSPTGSDPAKITARGQKTRQQMIKAAREIFEEVGFVDARIYDIAKRARAANGSFYTYFSSKEEILEVAAMEVLEDLDRATHLQGEMDPAEAIATVNEAVLDAWIRNGKMLTTLYQVAGFRPAFFNRMNDRTRDHQKRFAARLRQWQQAGLIDAELDPVHAAVALDEMVEHSLRWWIGFGETFDRDTALKTLNRLWINGIGLRLP
jgi:AcrR family transcriptional regulator